ncbi:MAG: hypothetical protein Q8P02_01655 [Candidatus Micrarchaeota archaeon]|nr:hypothetical protein [Candidatus Micrarchaeota archaeon]
MLAYAHHQAFVKTASERICLDGKAEKAFVSHAHFDHYRSLKKAELVLSSPETMALLAARGKTVPERFVSSHEKDGARFSLLDAGHVLGSRMLYCENGESFLYTGDFLSEPSFLGEGAKPVQCDTLLLECTYGSPEYAFGDRFQVYDAIGKWANAELAAGRIAVIGAYALGKAQQVVSALNSAGICPVVSEDVAAVNAVYNQNGFSLEYACNDSSALKGAFAAVLPMHKVKAPLAQGLRQAYGRQVRLSVATGWASQYAYGVDRGFVLSDHNDFEGLVGFVEACHPKKVYTTHGPSERFARELQKRGFDATPLESMGESQPSLASFQSA